MHIINSADSNHHIIQGWGNQLGKVTLFVLGVAMLGGAGPVLCAQDVVTPSHTDSIRPVPEPTSVAPPKTVTEDYLISPDDELDIFVLDVADAPSWHNSSHYKNPFGVQSACGNCHEPGPAVPMLIRRVQALGEIWGHLTGECKSKDSRLHSIAIAGSVKRPQIYPVLGKTTLMDALSQAEGLTDDAGNSAVITRGEISSRLLGLDTSPEAEGGDPRLNPRTVVVDLKRLMEDGDPKLNYDLYPGDRVTVQKAGIVYVEGAVNRPGGFVLKEDREQMTVLKALALAEYVKSTADTKKAVIIRGSAKGPDGTQEIPVDLDKMLKRRAKDRVLLANDILLIPDSASKRAIHRAGEAAAEAAALVVYRY